MIRRLCRFLTVLLIPVLPGVLVSQETLLTPASYLDYETVADPGFSPDGKVIVYLARGEDVYTVKVGDLIEAQYRLDSLDETRATLTYLPMNQQQMLAILPR